MTQADRPPTEQTPDTAGPRRGEGDGGHGAVRSGAGDPGPASDAATASAGEPVTTLLVLGASGDLAARLLLPGLAQLLASTVEQEHLLGRDLSDLLLVGAGVEDWDEATWREHATKAFAGAQGPAVDAVREHSRYQRADLTAPDDLRALLEGCTGPVAIYFALPPKITAAVCASLQHLDLPAGTRLVMEKPFGVDEASAHELNQVVSTLVPEDHVHRVDHFLGRSTALNVLGLRFGNRLFEPVWNAEHVERVDVVYDEELSLEGRARYYDTAGALVDMIQSHLLQVVALLAMEPPASLDERDLRDATAAVLRSTRLAGDPAQASRRGRYTAGRTGGEDVPDYAAEPGVQADRGTETLAEVVLHVDTWRWAGVPFRLRSGKAIGDRRKEAVITFKAPPHVPRGLTGPCRPTRLRLGFSPDAVSLDLTVNSPGDPFELDATTLSAQMGAPDLPAYGEVLGAVLAGDPRLSVRGDAAEDCWRIVDPVLAAWRAGEVPLEEYPAGGGGPAPTDAFPLV